MNILILGNKHKLAWNEYGMPDGEPVLYFHGTPGSSIEASSADIIAKDLGIRLIAPDRPGYGDSDPHDDFGLVDWPDVISQLADKLNLKKFSILGYSIGGPYALVCAHEIPERINRVILVGSTAPFESDAMQNHINADFKPLYELSVTDYPATIKHLSQLASSPEALREVLCAQLPDVDLDIVKQKSFHSAHLKTLRQALNNGVHGIANDLQNVTKPWQFNIQKIPHKVDIWHGRDDQNVGFPIGEYLAETIQNPTTYFIDNAGHYFLFKQWQAILQNIVER